MRDWFDENVGGNAGLYSLAVGAVVGAALFAATAVFPRADDVETGRVVDAVREPTAAGQS